MKAPYIGYSQNPESIDMMKKIKHLFDPKGILVGDLGIVNLKAAMLTSALCFHHHRCHTSISFDLT